MSKEKKARTQSKKQIRVAQQVRASKRVRNVRILISLLILAVSLSFVCVRVMSQDPERQTKTNPTITTAHSARLLDSAKSTFSTSKPEFFIDRSNPVYHPVKLDGFTLPKRLDYAREMLPIILEIDPETGCMSCRENHRCRFNDTIMKQTTSTEDCRYTIAPALMYVVDNHPDRAFAKQLMQALTDQALGISFNYDDNETNTGMASMLARKQPNGETYVTLSVEADVLMSPTVSDNLFMVIIYHEWIHYQHHLAGILDLTWVKEDYINDPKAARANLFTELEAYKLTYDMCEKYGLVDTLPINEVYATLGTREASLKLTEFYLDRDIFQKHKDKLYRWTEEWLQQKGY